MHNKTLLKTFSLIFLGFFLINSLNSYSQEENKPLKWSYGIKDYGHGIENLGATEQYMLVQINNNKSDIAILSLTNFNTIKRVKAFTPKVNNQSLTYEKGIVFKKEFIVLANNANKQYVLHYSLPKFKLIKSIEIGSIKASMEISDEQYLDQFSIKKQAKNIEFFKSDDKNSLMVLYNNSGLDSSGMINYVAHIISPYFNDTTYSINLDGLYHQFDLLNTLLTNEGIPYLFYKLENEDNQIQYNLYDGNIKHQLAIEMPIVIYNQKLIEDQSGILILGICYFDESYSFFQYNYLSDMQRFGEMVFTNLDADIVSEIEKTTDRNKDGNLSIQPLNNYYIDGSIMINDDTRMIYGENYSLTKVFINKKIRIRHTAKELFILVTNTQGELLFFRTFPKLQNFENSAQQNPSWGSYIFFHKNEEFHFLFQEDNDPFELSNSKAYKNKKVIKPKGKASKTIDLIFNYNFEEDNQQWLDNTKLKIYPSPFISIDLGKGLYIIGSENTYDATKQIFKFSKFKYREY